MKVVVDRFEGEYAVCEKDDRTMINIKKSKLPADIQEQDVLVIVGVTITIGAAEAGKRKSESSRLMDDLFRPQAY